MQNAAAASPGLSRPQRTRGAPFRPGKRLGEIEMRPEQRRQRDRRAPGQLEERARHLLEPLDEPDQPAEALPLPLVAAGATVRPPELDQDAGEATGQAGAAQAGALERTHLVAERALVLAVARERMLERSEQGDRRDAVDDHARGEQQEGAGRGLIERRARGIVDLDAPAAQLGGDPAGELTVARDQGGAALGRLERGAHAQRQGERFARQIGVAFQHQTLERRGVGGASCCQAAIVAAGRITSPSSRARAGSVPTMPAAAHSATAARSISSASSSCFRPYCGWLGGSTRQLASSIA